MESSSINTFQGAICSPGRPFLTVFTNSGSPRQNFVRLPAYLPKRGESPSALGPWHWTHQLKYRCLPTSMASGSPDKGLEEATLTGAFSAWGVWVWAILGSSFPGSIAASSPAWETPSAATDTNTMDAMRILGLLLHQKKSAFTPSGRRLR